MIIKSMSRQAGGFSQLATYISRAPASELAGNLATYISRDAAQNTPAILNNLVIKDDQDPGAIAREFSDNAALLPKRANGVELYHEILAFSPEDAPVMTFAMIEDLTHKYLELRAPNNLGYAKVHFDQPHIHVHVMISANAVGSSKRHWLTKAEFAQVKSRVNDYQQHRWPELVHSVVRNAADDNAVFRAHASIVDDHIERRSESVELKTQRLEKEFGVRSLTKPEIFDLTTSLLAQATSEDHFARLLAQHELSLVKRGKSYSVKFSPTGRSYRLRSIGLQEPLVAHQKHWQAVTQAKQQLETTIANRQRLEWRERTGFAARILAIVSQATSKASGRLVALANVIKKRLVRDTPER